MAPNSMSGSSPESGYSGIDTDGVRRGRRRRRTAWSTSAAYRVVDIGGVPRGRRLTKYGVVDADGVPLSRSGPRRGSSQAMVMTSAERAGGERLQRSAPGPGNSLPGCAPGRFYRHGGWRRAASSRGRGWRRSRQQWRLSGPLIGRLDHHGNEPALRTHRPEDTRRVTGHVDDRVDADGLLLLYGGQRRRCVRRWSRRPVC
jgi:hypothetical protein